MELLFETNLGKYRKILRLSGVRNWEETIVWRYEDRDMMGFKHLVIQKNGRKQCCLNAT